jgi:hypothetical protein
LIPDSSKFAPLGKPMRIWAVGAVHGEVDRLAALHDRIAPQFRAGDRLVYLGNFIGRGPTILETVDELLAFRREALALPGMMVGDLVYLRGAQEEMWQKLLQLQFAPNPPEVLSWMLGQGVEATLRAYGGRPEEGLKAARDGAVQLTRWTNRLRESIRAAPGHNNLYTVLKRAAFCDAGVLLVSAGLDIDRPLAAQGDSFWWGGSRFAAIDGPYETFRRVVRGFDAANEGVKIADVTASLDGGCGRGGNLAAALFHPEGEILELVEV